MSNFEFTSWDQFYMSLVFLFAMKSKDRSTKVGCVIADPETNRVISMGYNGFPRGVDDNIEERHERPNKYLYTEHAERNAIYNADTSLSGCYAYVNLLSCSDCTRGLIQKRISRVYYHKAFTEQMGTYKDHGHTASIIMFEEAGVDLIPYEGPVTWNILPMIKGEIPRSIMGSPEIISVD